MADMGKYRKGYGLDGDPIERSVLLWFGMLIDGKAPVPDVFKMLADEDVRRYLDDDDYAIWCDMKAEHGLA